MEFTKSDEFKQVTYLLNHMSVYKPDNVSFTVYIDYFEVHNLFYSLQVSRAMELKGHTAGVYHFSFSADSTRYLIMTLYCSVITELHGAGGYSSYL